MGRQVMRPILVGEAKCKRKGHCPPTKYSRCSRCGEEVASLAALMALSDALRQTIPGRVFHDSPSLKMLQTA
jgi:hypothetical protein